MEKIQQAVERAKTASGEQLRPLTASRPVTVQSEPLATPQNAPQGPRTTQPSSVRHFDEVAVSLEELEKHRIVAHNPADPRSRAFDMLRTQVLQAMDKQNWHFLAVTSPTVGCGKSVTAINLAMSIARQPDRSALLVDMDLQRPAIADYLGIRSKHGLRGVIEGQAPLAAALLRANVVGYELMVLPAESSTVHSSELIGSRATTSLLQDIRKEFKSRTVIFDMPPLLQGDEVLALLPRIDCVLLVTAAGVSTQQQVVECNKHLQSTEVVRLVLNKAAPTAAAPYYY
jgi:Mrp family chromosome partitioning ATPase